MSADPQTLRIITGWLNGLAELTRHGSDGRPSDKKLALHATMLGQDFPSGAFTAASLQHAAVGHDFWPSYDAIRARVSEWWRDNRPRPTGVPALESPAAMGPDALDAADRAWLAYWHKRSAEIGQCTASRAAREMGLERVASLVRVQSPRAWALIELQARPNARRRSFRVVEPREDAS